MAATEEPRTEPFATEPQPGESPPPPDAGSRPRAAVVPRWVQLVLLPVAIVAAWAALRAAGPVVLIFTVAALIALLLNPFVSLLRRRGRLPRGLAVLVTYLTLALVLAGLGALLADPLADQVSAFQESVPELVRDANASLDDLQAWLDRNNLRLQVKEPGRSALASVGDRVADGSGELVSFTREALVRLVEASIALILIVVISIYMSLYGERIGAVVRSVVPRGDGTTADDYPSRVQRAVFGYVRGQLLFSLIMGTSAGVALWVAGSLGIFPEGKEYALFFGAWFGFAELIPYVGPAIGAAPPVLIALFTGSPLDAVWLVVDVHRAPTARGPRGRAAGLLPGAADQPVAGDLRAALRRAALRDHRRLARASHRGGAARERRLLPPPPGPRAVGDAVGGGPRRGGGRGRRRSRGRSHRR